MHHADLEAARGTVEVIGPERVREAVIAAARKLFAERGIHGVSVREIAREIGVSHTLLHLYFGSKEEILRRVLGTYDESFTAEIANIDKADRMVEEVFRKAASESELARVLAAAIVEGIVPDRIEAGRDIVQAMISSLEDSGAPDAVDARVVACLVASSAIGWAVASDVLKESAGLTDMEDGQLADRMAMTLQRLVAAYA